MICSPVHAVRSRAQHDHQDCHAPNLAPAAAVKCPSAVLIALQARPFQRKKFCLFLVMSWSQLQLAVS